MYTVIGHPRTRTLRVIWALEEMGLDYEVNPTRPGTDAVKALNASGKVPVLVTPEGALSDSVAILTYLADTHGQLTYPCGTFARAQQDAAVQFIVAEVDAACWSFAKHKFALPADRRIPEMQAVANYEFGRALGQLAEMKGDKPFIAGDMFTVADILLSHCAGWALSNKFDMPGGDMGDYLKSLRKRPAMARALATIPADA